MDESIALTSIGRDGERSDLVTNTKKPEIFVYDGTIIATAEKLLFAGGNLSDSGNDAQKNGMNSGISREILDTTGMPTPMGEVIILRACSDGFIQLAGPSMTAQLARLKKRMFELGAAKVIIDGALSRKSLECRLSVMRQYCARVQAIPRIFEKLLKIHAFRRSL